MSADRIQIYPENPRYWQYKGEPVLLIGGSVEDNLFQIPNLEEHLDRLHSVGGNYVRCTMSCRDEGDVWPFAKVGDLYDLDRWNAPFWQRFRAFIELTAERDIVVQIEVWATFDYYRDNWAANPFNPKNNRNYTAEETELPEVVDSHPTRTENNFFWSVPGERNQTQVLHYQQKFVDEMLNHTLPYGHVLYCMDNETSVTPAWGEYWATYIQDRAAEAGVQVETTEMWDAWDVFHEQHRATLDHPEIYSFCDISQNNHQKGQTHWDNAQRFRATLDPIRPINNVKIYGADGGRFGDDRDGLERFWRNVLGGLASARFHRPSSGQGLNANAQAHLKSMRMLTSELNVFRSIPDSQSERLSDRDPNEAYLMYQDGEEYAVYFPDGGSVALDLSDVEGDFTMKWLDIANSRWQGGTNVEGGRAIPLAAPGGGHWAALLQSAR